MSELSCYMVLCRISHYMGIKRDIWSYMLPPVISGYVRFIPLYVDIYLIRNIVV